MTDKFYSNVVSVNFFIFIFFFNEKMGNDLSRCPIPFYLWQRINENYINSVITIPESNESNKSFQIPPHIIGQILMKYPELIEDNKNDLIEFLVTSVMNSTSAQKPITKHLLFLKKRLFISNSRLFNCLLIKDVISHHQSFFQNLNVVFPPNSDQIVMNLCLYLYSYVYSESIDFDSSITDPWDFLTRTALSSCFDFPCQGNLIHTPEYTGILSFNNAFERGMICNGYFLFILNPDLELSVFPISENGSLLSPFIHHLNVLNHEESDVSMFLLPNYLGIVLGGKQYFFLLSSLTKNSEEKINCYSSSFTDFSNLAPIKTEKSLFGLRSVNQIPKTYFYVSDGVVNVFVNDSYQVYVISISERKILNCVELHQGDNCEVNSNCSTLLPSDLLSNPCETNGAYLSFFIRIGDNLFLCRQFSLLNGEHVSDSIFESDLPIVSVAYDTIHQMHYVTLNDHGRLFVTAYSSCSSINPFLYGFQILDLDTSNENEFFIEKINFLVLSSIFSNNILSVFKINSLTDLLSLISNVSTLVDKGSITANNYIVVIQILVIVVVINLKSYIETEKDKLEEIYQSLFLLIDALNKNVTFSHLLGFIISYLFDSLDFSKKKLTIVLDSVLTQSPDVLINYIVHQTSISAASITIPVHKDLCVFNNYIQDIQTKVNDVNSNLKSFFIAHQKGVIRTIHAKLKVDEFASIELFSQGMISCKNDKTLDIFKDYLNFLTNQMVKLMILKLPFEEFKEALIKRLFENFLLLIGGLTESQSVAQICIPLLFYILPVLKDKYPDQNKSLLAKLGLIFGALAATLLKGGNFSFFESRNKWLIESNIDLMDNIDVLEHLTDDITYDSEQNSIESDILQFLQNGAGIMANLYKKWKPLINKNVKEPLLTLDRLFLAAELKHLNLLEKVESVDDIRPLLEQMVRVRNTARSLIQNGQSIDKILTKCRMLLRLKSNFIDHTSEAPKMMADFVISSDSSSLLINFIANQKNRLQLTLIGFQILNKVYSYKLGQHFENSITVALSQIDNFDGLATILHYSPDRESINTITDFINDVIQNHLDSPFLLMPSIKLINSNIIGAESIKYIITQLVIKFIENENDVVILSLIYNNVGQIQTFLQEPIGFNMEFEQLKDLHWFLIDDALLRIDCSYELFKSFVQFFIRCKLDVIHYVTIAIIRSLATIDRKDKRIRDDFEYMIYQLGTFVMSSTELERSSEIVQVFRYVLKQSNDLTFILLDIFQQKTCKYDLHSFVCGIFSILGGFLEMSKINGKKIYHDPISKVYSHIFTLMISSDEYYSIQLPITSDSKCLQIQTNDTEKCIQSSMIEFSPLMMPDIDFLLQYFTFAIAEQSPLSYIYLSSFAVYLKDSEVIDAIPEQFAKVIIEKLQDSINPLDSIYSSTTLLSKLVDIKEVDMKNDFSILISEESLVKSYLSPIINDQNDLIHVKFKFKDDDEFQSYIGIVEDSFVRSNRFMLIHIPTGIEYPIQTNNGKTNPNARIPFDSSGEIKFTVDMKRHCITVSNQTFDFSFLTSQPHNHLRIYIGIIPPNDIFEIEVPNSSKVFIQEMDADVNLEIVGFSKGFNERSLLQFPNWTQNLTFDQIKKHIQNPSRINKFAPITANDGIADLNEYRYSPPLFLPLNCFDCDYISKPMKELGIKQVSCYLFTQFSTIVLVRLINQRYISLFKNEFCLCRLFSLLVSALTPLNVDLLKNKSLFFHDDTSILDLNAEINYLNMSIQDECRACLQELVNMPMFIPSIQQYIASMMNTMSVHTSFGLHFSTKAIEISGKKSDGIIVTVPFLNKSFNEYIYINNENSSIPFISIFNTPSESYYIDQKSAEEITCLKINLDDNNWILGTPLEILLLLKQLYLFNSNTIIKNDGIVSMSFWIRTIIVDLYLIQSPLVWSFLPSLLLLLTNDFQIVMKNNCEYALRLLILGSFVKSHRVDPTITAFYCHEISSLTSDLPSIMAPYFLEFFSLSAQKSIRQNIPKLEHNFLVESLDVTISDDELYTQLLLFKAVMEPNRKSIVGFPFWGILPIWISIQGFLTGTTTPIQYNIEHIHDFFVDDMQLLVLKWKPANTFELLSLIPPYLFAQNRFIPLYESVSSSTIELLSSFSPCVVYLVLHILHFINYAYKIKKYKIPKQLWNSISDLISLEEAANQFVKDILIDPPFYQSIGFKINRHEARRMIVDGYGNQLNSVIAQFSSQILLGSLRHKGSRVWRVEFIGEKAVDAGGPTRELYNEISTSIFEKTSRLCVPVPNNRLKIGPYRDTFVPFVQFNGNIFLSSFFDPLSRQYRAIGQFIGIVIRNGYPQYLPFAPLVWKFLAGGRLTENDIVAVDQNLQRHFERIRKAKHDPQFSNRFQLRWIVENWDGSKSILPNYDSYQIVRGDQVELYISKYIQFRYQTIQPNLVSMRYGFYDNIGFSDHQFMSANLISLLAQGTNVITTEQLEKITNLENANRAKKELFWGVVSRMNNRQRSLLLKFVTTLTRLPNPEINPSFKIHVSFGQPNDQMLPTASTCFNRLYLPLYSSQEIAFKKITLAIEVCQTMENS